MTHAAADRASHAHAADTGRRPAFIARAPGRVNLIGEHTDYNDGFVLPMALPFDTAIAATRRADQRILVSSEGFGHATFAIDDDPTDTVAWARYVHGMAHMLVDEGHEVAGWTGHIATDIPAGASLSSSAALEVASGLALRAAAGHDLDPATLARLGQRVENEVFGLPSGIMDQLASAASQEGCASLIDCRDLSVRPVALPPDTTVVVMDTGTRRELVDSEYAERQATCVRVAAELGMPALRDLTLADLDRLDPADALGRARATHVISENERTLAAVEAMEAGDAETVGRLMDESHRSLRDLYEVSGPSLDAIVAVARSSPGCLGARMTGGGFAGGAVALVRSDDVAAFCDSVMSGYAAPPEQPAVEPVRLYPVRPAGGADVGPA